MLWRAGLRISEALALTESDIDARHGSVLVRHGKNDRRREAGMDDWGFEHLLVWLERRVELAVAAVLRHRWINSRAGLVGDIRAYRTPASCD